MAIYQRFLLAGYGLTGLAIAPNGISIMSDAKGDGYVQFTNPAAVEKALTKHKETIRHRWAVV